MAHDSHTKSPCLSVIGLSKKYGRHPVFSNLSFSVLPGQIVGIAGANGSGKSTLLSILAGALRLDAGQIFFEADSPITHPKLFSTFVGYVPQDNPLMQDLTVQDNLTLWYPSKKALQLALHQGLLAEFQLDTMLKKPVRTLSGGMKKRVSLACALASTPKLLLLDEPCAALDLVAKADILHYLDRFRTDGGTVLLITHDLEEIKVCDRLLYLDANGLTELDPEQAVSGLLLDRMRDTNA